MNSFRNPLFALSTFLILALFSSTAIHAGMVYEITTTDYVNGEATPEEHSFVSIYKGNVKMAAPKQQSDETTEVIFQGDRSQLVIIDHQQQRYFIMDEAMIAQINAQMQRMQEMMKDMSPAKREMMAKMMKGRIPEIKPAEESKVDIRETDEQQTINGSHAVKYEIFEDDLKTYEYWIADWSEIKGDSSSKAALQGMSSFFNNLMDTFSKGPMGNMLQNKLDTNWMAQLEKFNGFPVLTRDFSSDGTLIREASLTSITDTEMDEADFQAPEGYTRQKMDIR